MTSAGGHKGMRRKAGAGRKAPSAPPMTPERALGQAMARAAQDLMALPLRVISARETAMTLADLPEALEDRALLAVLEGPAEGLGLMMLSAPVLSALLEMRMMGRLATSPPAPRRPTRTDAAMAADVIDAALAAFETALAGDAALIWAGGFRYGSFLADARPLPLILEETGYRVFRLMLELGAGGGAAREGEVLLALPAEGRGSPAPPPDGDEGAAVLPAEGWEMRLEQAVMAAPGQVEAVLARISLPVGAILDLRPGAMLPLAPETLEHLRLEGPGGRLLARARLGQQRGFRAVRLTPEGAEAAAGPAGVPAVAGQGWSDAPDMADAALTWPTPLAEETMPDPEGHPGFGPGDTGAEALRIGSGL